MSENNNILKVENISKQYRLGVISSGTISHDLNRWWSKIRGKEDPFLKIGESNDRTTKGESDYVWALQDINFEVKHGEVLGIIGKNGAGKSTLLKLFSRVTGPTTGSIKSAGRIASLLEVGTGFHPELTGKENIFLNGAILGMTKAEIRAKLDEIIEFSGCERYVDTPVKRYSSGMRVRLAFAVAAFLEPDILVVDEVLAVGDAEFQKKAIGKMKDISDSDGRTVLFVSHNMTSVRDLCTRALILENGKVKSMGTANAMVDEYLSSSQSIDLKGGELAHDKTSRRGNGKLRFIEIKINNQDPSIDPSEKILIETKIQVNEDVEESFFKLLVRMDKSFGSRFESSSFLTSSSRIPLDGNKLKKGNIFEFNFEIAPNTFRTGLFPLYFWLGPTKQKGVISKHETYDVVDSVHFLNIKTYKTESELGYDPLNPLGYFNLKLQINE